MTAVITDSTERQISVAWEDGTVRQLSATWLRDNIPAGRHRAQGQRTFDINELDPPSVVAARLDGAALAVDFADLTAEFPLDWIKEVSDGEPASGRVTPPKRFWDSSRQRDLEFAEYESLLSDDAALLSWLAHLRDYGYALLRNAPIGDGTVLQIAELFGFVRETNYGRLFDVTVTPDPANLANTSVRIGMHTDNPYRDPVPGLQLLNCLVNEASGGESQLCDGFRVADGIRRDAPEAFRLLTEYPVGFRYVETGQTDLQSYQPLIEVDALGEIRRIRYNSRSAAAIRVPAETVDDFYAAYRLLSERLNAPESLIEFRLEPGDCVIFDNERVLHGRASFELGHRHLQGCYADKDALHSKIRVLEAG